MVPEPPWVAVTVTVKLAVALAMFGALAVMVTDPVATPVTGTETVVEPVAKLTVAGKVATLTSLELRLTTSPSGAGADRFSARSWVTVPVIARSPEKLIVVGAAVTAGVTCTWALAVG
jgi:hypothetical protein